MDIFTPPNVITTILIQDDKRLQASTKVIIDVAVPIK